MTIQELASEALAVQDACNLSGVVHGFSRAMTALREVEPGNGTDHYNHHPICRLWADKISHLTGLQCDDGKLLSAAYDECHKLATMSY